MIRYLAINKVEKGPFAKTKQNKTSLTWEEGGMRGVRPCAGQYNDSLVHQIRNLKQAVFKDKFPLGFGTLFFSSYLNISS